jgi:hypothetical protein
MSFIDEILQHKEDDIDKLAHKSEAGSASTGSGDSTGFTSVRGPESATLGINDAATRGADPHTVWDRGRSTEKDDRLRRASQLFSHPQLTQEFARQKVSTTQNKSDKSIYGDVLESVSLLPISLQTLNVSDFPELKEVDQRKSLDLFIFDTNCALNVTKQLAWDAYHAH